MNEESGLGVLGEMFDEDDPAAWRRLEELAAEADAGAGADESPDRSRHLRAIRASEEAINARDWDAFAHLHAEGFRQDDHRGFGAGPITSGADFVASVRNGTVAVPDVRLTLDLVAVDGDRNVHRQRWIGHAGDGGGAVELEMWGVATMTGDLVARIDLHDSEEAARRAFAGPADAQSPVAAVYAEMLAAFNARDWTRFGCAQPSGLRAARPPSAVARRHARPQQARRQLRRHGRAGRPALGGRPPRRPGRTG